MSMTKLAAAGLLISLLGGCATGLPDEEQSAAAAANAVNAFITAQKLVPVKKVNTFNLHDWQSLDDYHLIISVRHNEAYLVSLRNRCPGLKFANAIATDNRINTLYANTDSVIVLERPVQRCRISELHAISKEQLKLLREKM